MDQQSYTFSSKPRAIQNTRKAKGGYRQAAGADDGQGPVNIMHDPRVIRGSTYARANKDEEQDPFQQEKENRRRRMLEKRKQQSRQHQGPGGDRVESSDVDPIPGHKHMDVQTENYLEELTDKVPEVEEGTQTEAFMDRPPEPLFMPAKIGVDTGTQVDVDELFDFDLEVEPILEVLVGKTLEHAMMEVMEEEELSAIRAHQDKFEQQRNIELAEVQRLEAESKRLYDEKERRVKQERDARAREIQVCEKVAARAFAKDYLSDLNGAVFDKLMDSGTFFDPVEKEVETDFLPWLHDSVQSETVLRNRAERLADALIEHAIMVRQSHALQTRMDTIAEFERRKQEELEQKRLAEEEAARLQAEAEAKLEDAE